MRAGEREHDPELASQPAPVVLLVSFWAFTYVLFSVRGRLLPDEVLPWLSGKRLLAISLGTFCYWVAITVQRRAAGRSLGYRAAIAGMTSAGAGAALLVVRSGFDNFVGSNAATLADEVRWLLIWLGYFFAWLSIYVALAAQPGMLPPAALGGQPEGATAPPTSDDAGLWVQRNQQLVRLPISSIEWIEAEGNYARVHSSDGRGLLRSSLSQLESELEAAGFARVHRSVLCRQEDISAIRRKRSGAFVAELRSGAEIPVGRRFGQRLIDEARGRQRQTLTFVTPN